MKLVAKCSAFVSLSYQVHAKICNHIPLSCKFQEFFGIIFIYEPRYEKTGFCICENKETDQLHGNREADQPLCFLFKDSTIPLLSKSEISSL